MEEANTGAQEANTGDKFSETIVESSEDEVGIN